MEFCISFKAVFPLTGELFLESAKDSTKRTPVKRKRETYTIGFRVDNYYLALLEKGAAAYGISVHEYARQRLTELLDHQEETQILESISAVKSDVADLREDVARSLEVILVNITKGEPSKIRAWISENLRRE